MSQQSQTPEEYYNGSSSQQGGYQCVSLTDLVNNYLMSRGSDDWTKDTPRHQIIFQARRAIRELYFDVAQSIKAVSLELSPTLAITLPPDYVSYTRISWVSDSGELVPMAEDRRMNISSTYLQDHDYDLLFDNEGCILEGNLGGKSRSDMINEVSNNSDEEGYASKYSFCSSYFNPARDRSRDFNNGKFKVGSGQIFFDSTAKSKEVVLEYVSDGMYTGCGVEDIKIHKFAEACVMDYIYYELVKNRRNVGQSEKERARREFYNSKSKSRRRLNPLRYEDIIQVFKGDGRIVR